MCIKLFLGINKYFLEILKNNLWNCRIPKTLMPAPIATEMKLITLSPSSSTPSLSSHLLFHFSLFYPTSLSHTHLLSPSVCQLVCMDLYSQATVSHSLKIFFIYCNQNRIFSKSVNYITHYIFPMFCIRINSKKKYIAAMHAALML